jgi:hypothetical protein
MERAIKRTVPVNVMGGGGCLFATGTSRWLAVALIRILAVADPVAVGIVAVVVVVTAIGCCPDGRSTDSGRCTIPTIWIAPGVTDASIASTARDAVAWAACDRMGRAGTSGVTTAGVAAPRMHCTAAHASAVISSTATEATAASAARKSIVWGEARGDENNCC